MMWQLILLLTALFLGKAYAEELCVVQTRWQAVRLVRLEAPALFRIDVLELTDKSLSKPDVADRSVSLGDGATKQTLEQMIHDFAKRRKEPTEESPSGGDNLIDGSLFGAQQCEGLVKLWGRSINWRRYPFVVYDGRFEIGFRTKDMTISAAGTINWSQSGSPKLDNMSFRKESNDNKSKGQSWGFDIQNDLGEGANYLIVGEMSVW